MVPKIWFQPVTEVSCPFTIRVFSFAALLYSVFGVVIEKARGAEDDINTVAAGTLTGMLFKSAGRSQWI